MIDASLPFVVGNSKQQQQGERSLFLATHVTCKREIRHVRACLAIHPSIIIMLLSCSLIGLEKIRREGTERAERALHWTSTRLAGPCPPPGRSCADARARMLPCACLSAFSLPRTSFQRNTVDGSAQCAVVLGKSWASLGHRVVHQISNQPGIILRRRLISHKGSALVRIEQSQCRHVSL